MFADNSVEEFKLMLMIDLKQSCKTDACLYRAHVIEAAFMLILRRQNQRFETLIQNADPKRR